MAFEIRHAFRAMYRSPAFAVAVVATLLTGVIVVTSVVSYMYAIYFAPLPYHEAERIVNVGERRGRFGLTTAADAVLLLRQPMRSFERVSAYSAEGSTAILANTARPVRVLRVDTSFSPLFNLRPSVGRLLAAEEVLSNARVALIAYQLWEAQFGADSGAVGRRISLGGESYVIVGVLPGSFRFPYQTDFIVPIDEASIAAGASEVSGFYVLAKLRRGAGQSAATQEVDALSRNVLSARPRQRSLIVHPEMLDRRGRAYLPVPAVFVVAAVLVLCIACVNAANLFMARGAARRSENAVHAALGASVSRLIVRNILEAAVLSAIAVGLATTLTPLVVRMGLSVIPTDGFPSWLRIQTDYRVLLFACAVLVIVSLTVGLLPLQETLRFDIAESLKTNVNTGAVTGRLMRASHKMVTVQVAFGVALVITAVLLIKSYRYVSKIDFGYPAEQIATVWPMFDASSYSSPELQQRFLEDAALAVRAENAVDFATTRSYFQSLISADGASSRRSLGNAVLTDDDSAAAVRLSAQAKQYVVGDEYFDMLGLQVREGRGFLRSDISDGPAVVVVSVTGARLLWPGGSPVGRSIETGKGRAIVIGVVDDVNDIHRSQEGLTNTAEPVLYYSPRQARGLHGVLLARGDDVNMVRAIALSRIGAVDSRVMIGPERTLADQRREALFLTRTFGGLVGAAALTAIALSIFGTYAVVAFGVARRRREIAIRMAIGASRAAIARQVIQDTMSSVGLGLVVGLGVAAILARGLRALLLGVSTVDIGTYLIVPILMGGICLGACWLPVHRTTGRDPLLALRIE